MESVLAPRRPNDVVESSRVWNAPACLRHRVMAAMALLLISACVRRPLEPVAACAAPRVSSEGWPSVDYGTVTLRIPPEFQIVHRDDPRLGEWKAGPGRVIYFQIDRWAPTASSYARLSRASSCRTAIGGRPATLVSGWDERDGYVAAAIWELSTEIIMNITVTTNDRDEQEDLLSVLHSLEFKN